MIISGPTAIFILISQHAFGICSIIFVLCTIFAFLKNEMNDKENYPVFTTYLFYLSALSILPYLWILAFRRLFGVVEDEGFFSLSNINGAIDFFGGFACMSILLLGSLVILSARTQT